MRLHLLTFLLAIAILPRYLNFSTWHIHLKNDGLIHDLIKLGENRIHEIYQRRIVKKMEFKGAFSSEDLPIAREYSEL